MKYLSTRLFWTGFAAGVLAFSSIASAQMPSLTNTPTSGPPVWHGDVALGLALARGNANTFLFTGEASAENIWDANDLKLGADGQYGFNNWQQTNETQSASAIHGFTDYKRLFTERVYGAVRLDLNHDDVAAVRYRAVLGPSIGYYFIKTDASKLNADAGVSYLRQRLDDQGNTGYVTLHLGEHGEHAFNKSAKIWEDVQYYPQITQFDNYLLNSEAGAEAAFNTRFSLRVVADDHYNNRPATGRKSNDITLVSSLVYKY